MYLQLAVCNYAIFVTSELRMARCCGGGVAGRGKPRRVNWRKNCSSTGSATSRTRRSREKVSAPQTDLSANKAFQIERLQSFPDSKAVFQLLRPKCHAGTNWR